MIETSHSCHCKKEKVFFFNYLLCWHLEIKQVYGEDVNENSIDIVFEGTDSSAHVHPRLPKIICVVAQKNELISYRPW